MTTDPYTLIQTRTTPQSEQADPRQVRNSAGGYAFALDDEARIRRFLILSSDAPTYYASARDLTVDNADVVLRMAADDNPRLVRIIREISEAGRAPKNTPAVFALAIAASKGDDAAEAARLDVELRESTGLYREGQARHERSLVPARARQVALDALPAVCRTATHLFQFVKYMEQFRGWGPQAKRAVQRWYDDKPVEGLAYQAVKYRRREDWTHRDLLRLAKPTGAQDLRDELYGWITGKKSGDAVPLVATFNLAQSSAEVGAWVHSAGAGLPWEALPDAALGRAEVWEALLDSGLPMTALIRQLPRLTRLGVTRTRRAQIVAQLTDPERLRKARVHPVSVLVALRTYASGRSDRGSSTWDPDPRVIDALDDAFYAAFGAVEPTGKKTLLALDVSGSMAMESISGLPITPREASAAIALVTAAVEPDVDIVGFTSGQRNQGYYMNVARMEQINALTELKISPRQRLDDAIRSVSDLEFGRTDCSLPARWAREQGRRYDTIVIFTDNETYAGPEHPHEALRRYREHTGIAARQVVVGMTATGFTIADPSDPLSMDVVGFDSATPTLIADFSRGAI